MSREMCVRVLELIANQNAENPLAVHQIVDAVGTSQANISHVLRLLDNANLIRGERSGRERNYKIHPSSEEGKLTRALLKYLETPAPAENAKPKGRKHAVAS